MFMKQQTLDLTKAKLKRSINSSLMYFCKNIIEYQDVNEVTHGQTIQALESETKRKLICMPRGSLKSTLACVAYPVWILLRDPNARILIDSELYTNSKNFLREIKQILTIPILESLYGKFEGSCWNEGEMILQQRTKSFKEASITAGGVGTTKIGQHYDYIILDDPNSPDNTGSKEMASKVIDHYRYSISILEPTGTYVLIGTRYSELDLLGHVLQNELGLSEPHRSGEYLVT